MSDNQTDRPAFQPFTAIGVFFLVFGLAVIGAAFLDMPAADRVINVICGAVVMACGGGAFWAGRKRDSQP